MALAYRVAYPLLGERSLLSHHHDHDRRGILGIVDRGGNLLFLCRGNHAIDRSWYVRRVEEGIREVEGMIVVDFLLALYGRDWGVER
jgi:hypothetical protein